MHILLTGAAGQVGRKLLPKLNQGGNLARALVRQKHPDLAPGDALVVEPLNPQTDFASLLADIDILIHLADGFNTFEHLPQTCENDEAIRRAQTTRALVNAAAKTNIRIIYLSTIKTMCGAHADHVFGENSPAQPQSLYGKLKRDAEQAILAATQRYGSRAVILRFPVVFGLGKGSMETLLQLLDNPLPMPFKGLERKRSVISATSLIEATMAIVKHQTAQNGIYLVQDGALSVEEMTSLIRKGLGRPDRLFKLPFAVWRGLEKLPVLAPKVQRLIRPLELDDLYFRKTFNWHPSKPLQDAILEWAEVKNFSRSRTP